MSGAQPSAPVEAGKGAIIQTVDPATGASGKAYAAHTLEEARGMAAKSAVAQRSWRKTPFAARAKLMHAAARLMRERKARYAGLMAEEMGKPVTDGLAEIEKCAVAADYYADHAEAQAVPGQRKGHVRRVGGDLQE